MEKPWEANIEHKKKLTIEDVRFFFEQAEKFLVDLNEAHKTIIDRTNTLLTILTTVLAALIGFNIARVETDSLNNNRITYSVWVLIVYILLSIIYLAQNIRPTEYWGIGSQPKKIFNDMFFTDKVPNDKRIIRMLMSEIERYQVRIGINQEINEKKWAIFTYGIYLALAIPIVFLVSYLVICK